MRITYKKGFTIIELLAVAAIIAILSTVVITSLADARAKGRDAKRVSDIKNIELALKLYHADNHQYPNTLAALVPNYLPSIPQDPSAPSRSYSYAGLRSTATGASPLLCASFHLGAALETAHASLRDDADRTNADTICTGSAANFHGLSATGGSPIVCGTDQGSAGPEGTERCYDTRP
jgi:general secretion pathway protein G